MPSTVPKTAPPSPPPLGTVLDDGNGALELVSVLGCGGYGVVYRARDTRSSFPNFYAVKCLIRPSTNLHTRQRQLHLREIALHQLASPHPHVVSVQRVIDPPQSPYTFIVMDYCPDGDLFSMILHNRRYLGRDGLIKHVFLQLLDAVEYCHSLGIYHRDLKPENVLCFNNGLTLAVTDFGLATTDKVSSEFRTGSVYHMSPECQGGDSIPRGTYSPPSNDIWSLGIILLNLCTGRNPWKSATPSDQTFAAYLSAPSDFLPSVLPISQQLNELLIGVLDVEWSQRTGLKEFKERIKHMESFYSDDVIFEGSMARCPWEVGMNLDDDGGDEAGISTSYSPPVPSTPPQSEPTRVAPQKPSVQIKSHWSEDSDQESEMVFASPSRADTSSVPSHIDSQTSDATYGRDIAPPSHLLVRKRKPNLKLDINRPALDAFRAQKNSSPTVRSSDGTFTVGISSQAVSMRSASPEFPTTPPSEACTDYVQPNLHADRPGATAPPLEAQSEVDSASYHTSFDGDSLEASGFAYGSDSVSAIFQVLPSPAGDQKDYNNDSVSNIIKVLPSPEGDQKGYSFARYSRNDYFRSSTPSPSSESSYFYFIPDRKRSDCSMRSGDGMGNESEMDADWVIDALRDGGYNRSRDASMTFEADESGMQEDTVAENDGPAHDSDNIDLPASWTWADPTHVRTDCSFTFTTTPSAYTSSLASPIVADEKDDDEEAERASVARGLGLRLYPNERHDTSDDLLEQNPWALGLDTSGWGSNSGRFNSSPSEATAAENFPTQANLAPASSGSSAYPQQPCTTSRLFAPRPLPTPPDSTVSSPTSLSQAEIVPAYRTTISRTAPPSFQYIPPTAPPAPQPVLAPTPPKESKSPSRAFLRFAFPRAFSTPVPSPFTPGPSRTTSAPPPVPKSKANRPPCARPTPSASKSTTQPPSARRSRFSSTGYGPRARALDRARSRTRSKTRPRSLSRSPSPRNMLRTARNWFAGAAPGKLFERVGAAQVAVGA